MKIESVTLTNYRNYRKQTVHFKKNITVFVGQNGQGKTNLLESIYMLSTARSFRVKDDKDLIYVNADIAKVEAELTVDQVLTRLAVVLHPLGKTLMINKQPIKFSRQFLGNCNVVLFSPYDLDFFDGSPKIRRKFLDIEGAKLSTTLTDQLFTYNKLLKERNNHLKNNQIDDDYLDVIDQQLAQTQLEILLFRNQFIDFLNQKTATLYSLLSKQDTQIKITYRSSLKQDATLDEIIQQYQQHRGKDLAYRLTHIGVHRDDIEVLMDNQPVTSYGSSGQKRLLIIAMKLVLIQYIQQQTANNPILLLDDVFSELDQQKRLDFIERLPKDIQTIITTTELSHVSTWPKEQLDVYQIDKGIISKARF